MTEAQLQQEIITWFNNNYCLKTNNPRNIIFSVANESTYQNKNFKNTGTLAGVSDLIVVLYGKTIFIELKTEKGIQSDKQKDFEKRVKENNQEYYLVRSLQEFKNIFDLICTQY